MPSRTKNDDKNDDNEEEYDQQTIEIIQLTQSLDKALQDQEIEPEGLNPQRNEIYTDYFEQLLSVLDNHDTTTHNNPSSSDFLVDLLSRMKDELTMTATSYKKLYESSVTFGIQKALKARHERDELKSNIRILEDEKQSLLDQNDFLLRKVQVLEQKVKYCRCGSNIGGCNTTMTTSTTATTAGVPSTTSTASITAKDEDDDGATHITANTITLQLQQLLQRRRKSIRKMKKDNKK